MNKVITINLNGRAYQLEEAGYSALHNYLEQAKAKLHDDPDKDEIMADFEQAIADKCDARLTPRKNVMTQAEIEEIIASMGPVDASGGKETVYDESAAAGTAYSAHAPKRLYRIPRGEWLTGVCTGLAAYFGIDVTVVRVLFVLLIAITHGFGALVYVLLMIVMPVARTDEQLAAARGTKPFNAHDFIEQARARYAEFQKEFGNMPPMPEKPPAGADRTAWQKWKQDLKHWKRQWKTDMRNERHWKNRSWQNDEWVLGAGTGFFMFLMGLVIAALTLLSVLAIISTIRNHTIFGYALAVGHPLWVPIVFICAVYIVAVTPFKMLIKNARPSHWGNYSFFNDVILSIFFLFALYLAIFLGRELFPIVNEAYGIVAGYLHAIRL